MTFSNVLARARQDIRQALFYYETETSPEVAEAFTFALERAMKLLDEQPGIGSPRLATELGVPGLRIWPLRAFSHSIYYRSETTGVVVLRILHSSRDIGPSLFK